METRANYVLIGLFTLAVAVGVFGFVYWFQNIGGAGERAFFRVQFDGSVSGLRTGGTVLFNGIRVGEVTELKLNPERPQQVVATISIDKSVAVRSDTEVGLEFQGLTGIALVSLKGGSASAKTLTGDKANPPLLIAPHGSTQDVTQAARDALRKVQDFIEENQKAFHGALANLEKFSGALANNSNKVDSTLESLDKFSGALSRNSARVDKIAEGLQNLTGGDDGKGGEINEAARSIRSLVEKLDKRTEEITASITQLTHAGTRTLNSIDRAAKNFDANPSRILWGGSSASEEAKKPRRSGPR